MKTTETVIMCHKNQMVKKIDKIITLILCDYVFHLKYEKNLYSSA